MKKKYIYIALALMSLSSLEACKTAGKEANKAETDETAVTELVLKTDSLTFEESGDGYSCSIKVDFPENDDKLDLAVKNILNKTLVQMGPCSGPEEKPQFYDGDVNKGRQLIDFYGKDFAKKLKTQYDEVKALNEEREMPAPYTHDVAIRRVADKEKYATYEVTSYTYLGGAHGSSTNFMVNIDKESAKMLEATIDTTKTKELQPVLRKGVIDYFKECGETVKDEELDDMLFISEGIIPLPAQTPALTPEGLRFIYQQYEIGPYALGMVSFTVPYDKVREHMTKEAIRLTE